MDEPYVLYSMFRFDTFILPYALVFDDDDNEDNDHDGECICCDCDVCNVCVIIIIYLHA